VKPEIDKYIYYWPFSRTKVLLTGLEDCLILENQSDDQIKSQQGCPAYVSPEVLNSHQSMYSGKLSDSWSLGIILYTLLFGRYPFHHNQITTMFSKITRGKFQIPLIGISLNAKILLRSLIRLKPTERLLPNEIIFCNWFKDMPAVHLDPNVTMALMKKSASTYSAYNNESFVANQFSNLQSISRPSNTDLDLGDNQYVPVIK
jgi:serine/threonine protein kinase